MTINITRTNPAFTDLPLPAYATEGAAGMDIHAAIETPVAIAAGTVAMIPTALAIAVPRGYECQVRSRSGLAAKHGVFCLNSPGTIDSDYRGELHVILANFGAADYTVNRGDRIAQLVIARHERAEWTEVASLDETERGSGGFGSTGLSASISANISANISAQPEAPTHGA
ncbi:MAG: dUTP diphosphatase [Candidatus Kapabacteria bacterium]|nr:dUTP diphosphatase [Candidatus Kapabacteria bacterium]